MEENIQKSSQLASECSRAPGGPPAARFHSVLRSAADLGNRYASSGDFKKAVLLYTDPIKYNPREHK